MEVLLKYIQVFAVGGGICLIGQIFINLTKVSSARILVAFLLAGVILETFGIFEYIKDFGSAGATIPICGFGSVLARGAMEAAKTEGLYGLFTGGVVAATAGLSAAIIFGFIISLLFCSHNKR